MQPGTWAGSQVWLFGSKNSQDAVARGKASMGMGKGRFAERKSEYREQSPVTLAALDISRNTLVKGPGTASVTNPARARAARESCQHLMDLSSLLTVEQIIPQMQANERWGAIVELVDLLVKVGKVRAEDHDVVLNALKQREETMSTGIGFGIAIPHASSDKVGEVVAAFGRSTGGIEFDSLDNAPVRFVVLFVVPRDQFQMHLRTLAAIAKLLNDRTVREALGTADSAEKILAIFKSRGAGK